MKRTVTWLHLSDLHACPRDGWQSDRILRALQDDLRHLRDKQGLVPDFIFFTGDLAWGNDPSAKASLAEQFDMGHEFLEKVRATYEPAVPQRRVYLVPGNHDIDRKRVTKAVEKYLPTADLVELRDAFRDKTADLESYMLRLDEYRKFLSSKGYGHLATDPERLVWADEQVVRFSDTDDSDSIRVGIVGYNSAWSCFGANDRGNLRLCGDWQHEHLHNQIRETPLRIGLIHHPFNWFKDHDEVDTRERMKGDLHFILHGHEHRPGVDPTAYRTTPPHENAIVSAGSCYDRDGHPDGYNIVRLDLNTGEGEVYLRKLSKAGRNWGMNTDHKSAPNGIWPIPCMKLKAEAPAPEAKATAPAASGSAKDKPASPATKNDAVSAQYTADFRQAVHTKNNYLDLPGITVNVEEAKNYDLSVAYVSLSLLAKGGDKDSMSRRAEDLLDYLPKTSPRLVITGPAGSGKSTLLRWVALKCARPESITDVFRDLFTSPDSVRTMEEKRVFVEKFARMKIGDFEGELPEFLGRTFERLLATSVDGKAIGPFAGRWPTKLPFLIRLRDFPDGTLPSLANLTRYVAPALRDAPAGFLADLLEQGGAILMFDGVDEIPPDKRPALGREIEAWMKLYPKCHFLVTSRPDAVADDLFGEIEVSRAEVQPLTPDDRTMFIDHWHKAVGQRRRNTGKLDATPEACEKLKAQLSNNPAVARLATNPLIAAAVCALHLDGKAHLPRNEGEVCGKLCEMLAHLLDRDKEFLAPDAFRWAGWEKLDYDPHKLAILSAIACAMVEQGPSSLPAGEVDLLIAGVLEQYSSLKRLEAAPIRKALIERSGLLRMGAEERVEFIHNTFKEFLAADQWAAMGESKLVMLADKAHEPAWMPVVRFVAMRAKPATGIAGKLAEALLTRATQASGMGYVGKWHATALRFLLIQIDAAGALPTELQTQIAAIRNDMLPPSSFAIAEALAACGEETIKELRYNPRHTAQQRAACVRALGSMEFGDARKELKAFEQDGDKTVLAELARYLNPLGFPKVQDALIEMGRPPDWCPREFIRDLEPLRGLGDRITRLNCWGTLVSDLSPLRGLTKLTKLSCPGTLVSDLSPLQGLTLLTKLYCGNTQVSDLSPLQGLTKLTKLYCGNTDVSDLSPLQNLTQLTELYCWGTQVSDLSPLRGLTQLKEIGCANTKVRKLSPLVGLPNLERISCSEEGLGDAIEAFEKERAAKGLPKVGSYFI